MTSEPVTMGASARPPEPVREAARAERIALFVPDLSGGGAERVCLNLAEGLAARGDQVQLVVMAATGTYRDRIPAGVTLVDLGSGRASRSVGPLLRYLRRERPDLLIAHLPTANLAAVLARMLAGVDTRLIVTVHNHVGMQARASRRLIAKAVPWLGRVGYRFADAVVAVSEGVARSLVASGVPERKVRTVLNPVVTPGLADQAREVAAHPFFEEAEPVVVAVGRLEPQKDFATLLRAVASLRDHPRARLVILGEGGERASLEALARSLGVADRVALPGFVPNPYPYMRRASLVVLSSRYEGLPTVLIEALALGTPVVATDCPEGPREILAGGRYGRLVPVGDPDALAEAIDGTLDDLASGSRRLVDDDAWNRFTVSQAIAGYLAAGAPR